MTQLTLMKNDPKDILHEGSDRRSSTDDLDLPEFRRHAESEHVQRLAALGTLVANFAHDFNNVLAATAGNADNALRLLEAQHAARPDLEAIRDCVAQASALCKQLLGYAGKKRPAFAPIRLSELVRSLLRFLEISAGRGVRLDCELREDLPEVRGDAVQLQQVLMNLVVNAADAIGRRPGTIRVATDVRFCTDAELAGAHGGPRRAGTYVSLRVTDSGPGIPQKTQRYVFDPHFSTKGAGRGLGLSITLGIVGAHSGVILVSSGATGGATFEVLIPASADGD